MLSDTVQVVGLVLDWSFWFCFGFAKTAKTKEVVFCKVSVQTEQEKWRNREAL